MAKLDKSTVALTFKFDCERFLRYRLATSREIADGVPNSVKLRQQDRPGINLITAQGRAWEALCYSDLVAVAPKGSAFAREGDFDATIGRRKFEPVENLAQLLSARRPPAFIVEPQFDIPGSVSAALKHALDVGRLKEATARPDVLWVRPFDASEPLIRDAADGCQFIIHVIDIKLAAEPSLRHFVEVTLYALALQAWLDREGLANSSLRGKFAVAARARVWPGTHEGSAFRSLVKKFTAEGTADPLTAALEETTHAVPFEIYKPQLQEFLDSRLPSVLATSPQDAPWHFGPKCQFCEFFEHCMDEAKSPRVDHLSQLGMLTAGHAQTLRECGIPTVTALSSAAEDKTPQWLAATEASHGIRAMRPALLAQIHALKSNTVAPIPGRSSASFPRHAHLNIYLTAHFDPGTGITFVFGASKVHFKAGGEDKTPVKDSIILPVSAIDSPGNLMSTASEANRLVEMCERIKGWLEKLHESNQVKAKEDRETAQIFVWSALEARHLGRVLERHLGNEKVREHAEFLMRVFPPEEELRSPDDLASQPVTIVKPVIKKLMTLPVAFDFTLLDARNHLAPFIVDGQFKPIRHTWGFSTPMNDQIPLERAYEVWQDTPILRKYDATLPHDEWPKYSTEEIRDEIKNTVRTHLQSLEMVVGALRRNYRDQLKLRKEPFTLKKPVEMRVPANSALVFTAERLNVVAAELENRDILTLPVDERESHFHSIRGLKPAMPSGAVDALENEVRSDSRYREKLDRGFKRLLIFEFSENSRDCRLREGAIGVVIRNESAEHQLDLKWYKAAGYATCEEATPPGLSIPAFLQYAPVKKVLEVTVARIESFNSPPLVAVLFDATPYKMATQSGMLKLDQPMVLDPIHLDFALETLEQVVRGIGGKKK